MRELSAFLKYNSQQFNDIVFSYIYLNNDLPREECEKISKIIQSFIDILEDLSFQDISIFQEGELYKWYIRNESYLTVEKLKLINQILIYGIEKGNYDGIEKEEIVKKLIFLFEFYIFISNKNQSLEITNRTNVLTLTKILINKNSIEGVASFLKEIEVIFNIKRNTYYSYVPSTDEIKGVLGKDVIGINQLKRTMSSQHLFHTSYHSKKVIYLNNAVEFFEKDLVDKYNITSIIIIPVFDDKKVYGWMVLDSLGEEIEITQTDISNLGIAGELLGVFLSKHNFFNWENEEGLVSNRDKEILYLLASGLGNKEIGAKLYLSEFTVRDSIGHLMIKFNAKNRTELVAKAIRQKIIR